jgi:hypothetical protein
MFDFKNYVMKMMLKFPSRHLIRLQGKLKLRYENIHIHKFLYVSVLQCTGHQPIAVAEE